MGYSFEEMPRRKQRNLYTGDVTGEFPVPQKGAVIVRMGKNWKVVHVAARKVSAGEIAALRVFLSTACFKIELHTLHQQQYEALQKNSYLHMLPAARVAYDRRRLRIGEIRSLLGVAAPWTRGETTEYDPLEESA